MGTSGEDQTEAGASTPERRGTEAREPVEELVDRRDARTRVFRNSDGTLTANAYLTPIHHRTAEGWQPIDNAISPGPDPGSLTTSGNSWTVRFGPVDHGVRLIAPDGQIRMRPVAASDRGAEPEVVSSPERKEPANAKEALSRSAIPEPGVVRYANVWPDVDLRYEVHGDRLKEDIVVGSSGAPSEFVFDVFGATFQPRDDGGLGIVEDLGGSFGVPPPTVFGADGADLSEASGVRYVLGPGAGGGTQRVTVVLDANWLAAQPRGVFPLVVDPTLSGETQTNAITINSSGLTSTSTPVRVGSQSGVHRRAAVHFSQYETYLGEGYRIYFANLGFAKRDISHSAQMTISAYDQGAPPSTFEEIGASAPLGSFSDPAPQGEIYWPFIGAASTADGWFAQNIPDQWFGVTGTESTTVDTLHRYDVELNMHMFLPPAPSRVANLTADQVLTTTTPTLQALAIPASAEGGAPRYDFQITTAPAPGTGTIVSSGWLPLGSTGPDPPSWQVPQGTLQEGITYHAWVLTDWEKNLSRFSSSGGTGAPGTVPPTSWGVPFTVDLGLGEGGPSPIDEVGAVPGQASTPSEGAPNPSLPPSKVNVNLVDGNASIAVGTPTFPAVSGEVGLRFTYNSLAAATQGLHGLRASFFNDANGNGEIDVGTDPLVGERVDPTVGFDHASGVPLVAGQDPQRALTEWTGHLTLPNSNTWALGAISSDGIEIIADGTVRLDDWGPHAPQVDPVFGPGFSPTPTMPVTIRWRHASSDRAVALVFAMDCGTDGTCKLPDANSSTHDPIYSLSPDWLTRSPTVLPAGWVVNTAAGAGRWISLADRGDAVTVFSEDGTGFEFRAVGDGSYTPPIEAPNDLLQVADDGTFILESANLIYTFGPTGALLALATAADDREPAALEYGYGGAPTLLRTITDPVRCAGADPCPDDSAVALSYGGDAGAPAGCSGAPAAMLCDIAYWDATSTSLSYDGSGRLVRITNPDEIVYDFAYDDKDRLTEVRDPLANAAIGAGVRPDDATARTKLTYTDGRVSSITQPAPMPGEPRPERVYCYGFAEADAATAACTDPAPKTTSVGVAGFTPTVGFAHRVAYDDRNRIVASTDSAGLTTTYVWDENDRHVATVDPAGVETSTEFDSLGYPVASHGPAPSSAFDDDGLPKPGADVPTSTTDYDGGLSGLAAAWHPNTDLRGNAAYHTTSDLDEDWSGACDSPSSCDGAGSLVPGSGFGGRLTGRLTLPEPGRIDLNAGGGRVFVDDHLVVDQQGGPYSGSVRADRPMHWWRLSEPAGSPVALDGAGDRPATYASTGVSLGQAGPVAGDDSTAAGFDGASGTARAPDGADLRFSAGQPFSVEAWVKTSKTTGAQIIASKLQATSPFRGWEVGLNAGKPYFYLVDTWSTNSIAKIGGVDVADGAWHHVVVTYRGNSRVSGIRFFVDGTLDGSAGTVLSDTLSGDPRGTADLYLGSRQNDGFFFDGALANVAVYRKALAAGPVSSHHSAAAATSVSVESPTIANTPYPGAVARQAPSSYWRLGEASGATAADAHGDNTGTYSGGVGLGADGPLAGDPATAAAFDGTGSLTVADAPELRFNQGEAFSVEAWIKTSSTAHQEAVVAKMPTTDPHRGWELNLRAGKPSVLLINSWSDDAIQRVATTSIADGAWRHVVATYDGSSLPRVWPSTSTGCPSAPPRWSTPCRPPP